MARRTRSTTTPKGSTTTPGGGSTDAQEAAAAKHREASRAYQREYRRKHKEATQEAEQRKAARRTAGKAAPEGSGKRWRLLGTAPLVGPSVAPEPGAEEAARAALGGEEASDDTPPRPRTEPGSGIVLVSLVESVMGIIVQSKGLALGAPDDVIAEHKRFSSSERSLLMPLADQTAPLADVWLSRVPHLAPIAFAAASVVMIAGHLDAVRRSAPVVVEPIEPPVSSWQPPARDGAVHRDRNGFPLP